MSYRRFHEVYRDAAALVRSQPTKPIEEVLEQAAHGRGVPQGRIGDYWSGVMVFRTMHRESPEKCAEALLREADELEAADDRAIRILSQYRGT